MPSQEQHSAQMRSSLALTEPDLDTSVGTVSRKIIDAVAEAMAEVSVDGFLLNYQYDIDSRRAADLDDFVRLFGFTRLPARRATGILTFERTTPALQPFTIPTNTQVSTEDSPSVVVVTVTPAVIGVGDMSVSVPAQALVAGVGSNIAADTARRPLTVAQGVTSITNPVAFEGGTDSESDDSLRLRFKRTLFRSLAGTEQMYMGTALEDPNVTQANVIGSVKRYVEQIELVSGTATSVNASAKYIYPNSSTFGPDIAAGDIRAAGIHYTFDASVNPPTITSLSGVIVPDGVYDFEYDYLPNASRNNPATNITNRVDIWAKGSRLTTAIETLIFDETKLFTNTTSDALYRQKFRRANEVAPTNGNFFVPFGFTPVASVPSTIVINGNTYVINVDYWLVQDITSTGRSNKSYSGIEFKSLANGLVQPEPDTGDSFQVTYIFNSIPRDINVALQRWRLVTQDAWVHWAKAIRLNLYFAVIFQPGFSSLSVKPEMLVNMRNFIDRIGFNGVVQTSDLLAVAHATTGVDAVRFITSTDDAVHYAIQRVDDTGGLQQTFQSGGRAIDVFGTDDATPVLNDIFLTAKAENSWGVG